MKENERERERARQRENERERETEMCVNVVKAVCLKQSLLGMYLSRKNVNKTFQSAQGRQPTQLELKIDARSFRRLDSSPNATLPTG